MPNFIEIGGVTRKPLVDLTRNDPHMESCQILWFASECSTVLRTRSNGPFGRRQIRRGTESSDETDEGADNATGHLDNVDWC